MSIRACKVAEQIKKELAIILCSLAYDAGLGVIAITQVKMSGNMQSAKIYISLLEGKGAESKMLSLLKKFSGTIRTELSKKLYLRKLPSFIFVLDKLT
ncbi:MAG: ribosome-binding factor [Bacillota bacterium]|jgi:ribosome-binding factor A